MSTKTILSISLYLLEFSNSIHIILGHFFHGLESAIPHINFETNLPDPIINVAGKYLKQFLDTSFGVASLELCCNIE